jgi:hypothetical protein
MTAIHALQLARDLRVVPSLAYRTPLSRIDAAIAAVSCSPAIGLAQRTLWEARQRKCGIAEPDGISRRETCAPSCRT